MRDESEAAPTGRKRHGAHSYTRNSRKAIRNSAKPFRRMYNLQTSTESAMCSLILLTALLAKNRRSISMSSSLSEKPHDEGSLPNGESSISTSSSPGCVKAKWFISLSSSQLPIMGLSDPSPSQYLARLPDPRLPKSGFNAPDIARARLPPIDAGVPGLWLEMLRPRR